MPCQQTAGSFQAIDLRQMGVHDDHLGRLHGHAFEGDAAALGLIDGLDAGQRVQAHGGRAFRQNGRAAASSGRTAGSSRTAHRPGAQHLAKA